MIVAHLKSLWSEPFFRKLIVAFIIIKIFILAMGVVGNASFPLDAAHRRNVTANSFLNDWAQYDGASYLDLAMNNYNKDFNNTGNFSVYPLYPLLIFLLSLVITPALAAFIISNIFSIIAVVLLYILLKKELDQKKAYRAGLFLMLFPTAYFMTAMYAESLYLALILGMFIAARKESWFLVGALGFLVSLARIQGIIMFVPMLYMYLRSKQFSVRKMNMSVIKPTVLLLLLIPAGMATMMLYQYAVTGDPLIQVHYGFGIYDKGFGMPWQPLVDAMEKMSINLVRGSIDGFMYNGANLVMFLFIVWLTYLCYKKLKPEYTLFLIFNVLFLLMSMNLRGIGRYAVTYFPIFMIFAMMYDESKIKKYGLIALYIIFVALLTIFIFRHVNQGIYLTLNYTFF